jgi:predicted metal-dependent hydrolase
VSGVDPNEARTVEARKDELVALAAREKRPNAIDAEWEIRPAEVAWRTRAAGAGLVANTSTALLAALHDAPLETARYALWLALPCVPDADLPQIAAALATLTDPDVRILAAFQLLGRTQSAPPWFVVAARSTLTAVDGKISRTMETLRENVRNAVDEPARFSLDEGLAAGARLFNAGKYFEAHEVWEDIWRPHRTPERDFFRGLINLAVAMNKMREESPNGVVRLLERADGMLASFAPKHRGLDVDALRKEMAALGAQARAWVAGERTGLDPALVPVLPERGFTN